MGRTVGGPFFFFFFFFFWLPDSISVFTFSLLVYRWCFALIESLSRELSTRPFPYTGKNSIADIM